MPDSCGILSRLRTSHVGGLHEAARAWNCRHGPDYRRLFRLHFAFRFLDARQLGHFRDGCHHSDGNRHRRDVGRQSGLRQLAAPASEGDSAGAGEYRCRCDRGWNLSRGRGRRNRPAGSDFGPVRDRFGGGDILAGDHVRRVAVHQPDQESGGSRRGDAGGGLHHQLPAVPLVFRFQLHGGRSLV